MTSEDPQTWRGAPGAPRGLDPLVSGPPSAAEGFPRLLGDIGGTNARFAWQAAPELPLTDIQTLPAKDHASLEAAMRHYLASGTGGQRAAPVDAAIGIANPVTGDTVQMTNHHWRFSIEAMRQSLGLRRFVVVNDFTALALSLPALAATDLRQLGGGAGDPVAPRALIGPGTGLGVSGLLRSAGGGWVPLAGEGGHVTLPAANDREHAVISWLRQRFGHPSAERAVSGQGLENLYQALCALDGRAAEALSAAEVSRRGLGGSDPVCREALSLFCALLGTVAGNLALTLGATGGVYVGGGIVPRLGQFLDESEFRARFEAKGRFSSLLAGIPVYVIDAAVSPALLGAAQALDTH
ncbi:MAG TPA: glucokinase [Ideonella sp.]|nr:glucokinase [Ideonella sp.]